jgi:hypothetical protein
VDVDRSAVLVLDVVDGNTVRRRIEQAKTKTRCSDVVARRAAAITLAISVDQRNWFSM